MVDAALRQDDPDTIFPVGCYSHIPDCGFYAGGRLFACYAAPVGHAWGELL